MARMTSRFVRAAGSVLLLAAASFAAGPVRIVVAPQPFSQGDVVTLASIARIDGDDTQLVERLGRIALGYAPAIGSNRVLSREDIAAAIESAGIDPRLVDLSMPPSVTIGRASQSVSPEQISQAVESYVRDRYSWPAQDFSMQITVPPGDVVVAQGTLVIRPSLPNFTSPADRFFVSVGLEVDGRVARYVSVELTVEASAIVAVASRPLARGDAITPGDARFERRRVGADWRRYVTSERELLGKAVAVSVPEGAVISPNMLNDRMLVKRGDIVNLVARAGRVEVFAVGESRGAGRLGDRVEVINRSSGRVVVGEIAGDKTIRVNY